MLKELHISNYRLFDELHIPELGQVNLIAGKNNTGKTALLEALRIWAAGGDSTVVNHVLKNRGEFIPSWKESYEGLFNRNATSSDTIIINEFGVSRWLNDKDDKVIGYMIEVIEDDETMPLGLGPTNLNPNVSPDFPKDNSIFVPFATQTFPLQNLWDKISLTPIEETVLEITRIIEPNLIRIDLRGEGSKVLLKGVSNPVSLKSLGDGLDRALWLAVALANAKNSLLLIDEFETGLHHSVQEMLWEKIFFYAKEWNIQVFATTHSMDTVRTFQSVANRPENQGKGKFFRLQHSRKGEIEAVTYNEEKLETVLELELDPR